MTGILALIYKISDSKKIATYELNTDVPNDYSKVSKYLFKGSSDPDSLNKYMTIIGYIMHNTPKNKVASDYKQTYSLYFGKSINDVAQVSTGNSTVIQDLKSSILKFYKNGHIEVRKNYVISNPLATLTEANQIMKAYYKYSLPQYGPDVDSNAQMQYLIMDSVIKPLTVMPLLDNIIEIPKLQIVHSNVEFLNFKDTTENIANYVYSKYKSQPKPNITLTSNHDIYATTSNELFYIIKKDTLDRTPFSNLLVNTLNNSTTDYSILTTNATSINSYITGFTNDFKDIIGKQLYQFYYTYNESYLDIEQFNNYSFKTPTMTDSNFSNIFFTSYNTFLINMRQTNDIKSKVIASKINNIADDILSLNIDMNKEYVLTQLSIITPNYSASNNYKNIVDEIQTNVANKQFLGNLPVVDRRFASIHDFTNKLSNISFNNLKLHLNTEYFNYIITEFYKTVSNEVNQESNSIKNIYLTQSNKFKIWKKTIIMVMVILGLIWVYYVIVLIQEFKKDKERLSELLKKANASSGTDRENELKDYFKEEKTVWMFFWFKLLIPTCFIVFLMAMIKSYQQKAYAAFSFNKEIIETNTNDLSNALSDLTYIIQSIKVPDPNQPIGKNIPLIQINELYEKMHIIIDRFEKCNYIIESQNTNLPFPYTEIIMDAFMLLAVFVCITTIYVKLQPLSRLFTIKDLNELKKDTEVANAVKLGQIKTEVNNLRDCHDADVESIYFTLKILFFLFIVMFLIFYTTKVINSTSDFEQGLYNSRYFTDNTCYGD